jgi:hypothetical protein
MDGRMSRRMYGRTEGLADERKHVWAYGLMGGWADGSVGVRMDERIVGRMDGWSDG